MAKLLLANPEYANLMETSEKEELTENIKKAEDNLAKAKEVSGQADEYCITCGPDAGPDCGQAAGGGLFAGAVCRTGGRCGVSGAGADHTDA